MFAVVTFAATRQDIGERPGCLRVPAIEEAGECRCRTRPVDEEIAIEGKIGVDDGAVHAGDRHADGSLVDDLAQHGSVPAEQERTGLLHVDRCLLHDTSMTGSR